MPPWFQQNSKQGLLDCFGGVARWPPLLNERWDTKWGFRSRLIISKSSPSPFLLFVFVYKFFFNLLYFFANDVFLFFLNSFADKNAAIPNFSLVNQPSLDKILKAKVFIHSDGQLRVAHLILGYTPISKSYQASKCIIKAKDPCLHWISVAAPGFLTIGPIPKGMLTTNPIPEGIPKVALPP